MVTSKELMRRFQKMKIKENKKSSKKKILIVSLLVLAILSIGFAIWYLRHESVKSPTSPEGTSIDYGPPSEDQLSDGQKTKEESISTSPDDTTNNPKKDTVNITITAKGATANIYQIRAFIDRVSNTGSCTVSLSSENNQLKNYQSVGTQALPEGSTCLGFDIPLGDLEGSSTWQATIQYTDRDGSVTGSTTTELSL